VGAGGHCENPPAGQRRVDTGAGPLSETIGMASLLDNPIVVNGPAAED
jgi:hypothetical protein